MSNNQCIKHHSKHVNIHQVTLEFDVTENSTHQECRKYFPNYNPS